LEKQASFLTSLCHELRVPASLALDKAQKMNTEIDKLVESGFSLESLNSIVENLKSSNGALPKQFEYLIKFIDSRLGVYSLTNEILTSKLEAESVVKYNMAEKINYYMRMFVDIAYDKKNKIGIIKDWKDEDCGELITHDDDIFLGLFMYLMHNAIKYSFFDLDKRKKFVPNYNHNFKAGSDGHIKVACFSDDSVYGYSITNWGKQIPKQFARDIFTEHFRCPIDPDFETQTSPVAGEGLGMYYAKIYADLIKAEIIPEVDGKKTKMTVLWKKDKKN
jgi:signal transduction histidine kinase